MLRPCRMPAAREAGRPSFVVPEESDHAHGNIRGRFRFRHAPAPPRSARRPPRQGRRDRHRRHRTRLAPPRAGQARGGGRDGARRRRRHRRGLCGVVPCRRGRRPPRLHRPRPDAPGAAARPGRHLYPAHAPPRPDRRRPARGGLGVVREASGAEPRRLRRRRGRGGPGRRPLRLDRLPAPLRIRHPARTPSAGRARHGPPAGRALPDHLVPRHRVLRRALARPLGDRGRGPGDGPRHPSDGSAARPARTLERGAGHGRPAGARRGDGGRLDRPGPLRERCDGDRGEQRAEPRRGQPHPHRLRTRHRRTDPSLRSPQRRLAHHTRPRRAGRRGHHLAGLRCGRAQFAS